jgi:TM2 domain-containing membrane protein YozV
VRRQGAIDGGQTFPGFNIANLFAYQQLLAYNDGQPSQTSRQRCRQMGAPRKAARPLLDSSRERSLAMSEAQDVGGKKIAAGICGILLGGFGVHRFILGDVTGGILRIVLCLACGLGGIIGLIEGIIYLTKSDEDFYQQYIVEKKGWF